MSEDVSPPTLADECAPETTSDGTGKVYLVGAGPGDAELLTVKARRLLDDADVVMYDSLVGRGIIESLPETAKLVAVGKKPGPGGKRTTQGEIHRLMVQHAQAGRRVVRLKGGDPSVFGRGGEETEHLAGEGVPFEVVPGVTSAIAAPNVVGIPVTHRSHASSVTVITGHEDPTKDESALSWRALAETVRTGGTLVILMGVRRLPENLAVLREHGVPAETPAALVAKATWETETTVTGTLETLVDRRDDADIEPPAVTVVGDVVGVREQVKAALDRDSSARQPHGVSPSKDHTESNSPAEAQSRRPASVHRSGPAETVESVAGVQARTDRQSGVNPLVDGTNAALNRPDGDFDVAGILDHLPTETEQP